MRGRNAAPQNTTPQSRWRYFFFDAFFDFFAFFLVAIMLTTFHAVRDLTVAHSWHYVPDRSDNFFQCLRWGLGETGTDDHRRWLKKPSRFWWSSFC